MRSWCQSCLLGKYWSAFWTTWTGANNGLLGCEQDASVQARGPSIIFRERKQDAFSRREGSFTCERSQLASVEVSSSLHSHHGKHGRTKATYEIDERRHVEDQRTWLIGIGVWGGIYSQQQHMAFLDSIGESGKRKGLGSHQSAIPCSLFRQAL